MNKSPALWGFSVNGRFNQRSTDSLLCVYLKRKVNYHLNHISVIMCNKVDERVLICLLYEWKLGSSMKTSYANLIRVYGPGAIGETTVARWYVRFRRGRQDLKRKTNIGVSRVLDDNELEEVVKEDPEITTGELARRFGVDVTTIRRHLKGISKGKKMTFVDFDKREQPIAAERLIPGAIPNLAAFRSVDVEHTDQNQQEVREEEPYAVEQSFSSGDAELFQDVCVTTKQEDCGGEDSWETSTNSDEHVVHFF